MSKKLVSVIMPAYNASETISASIESVLKQTYKNWELIIIDDYSIDNTFDIIKKYQENNHKIKIIRNKRNLRVAESRNRGLDVAQGDYIAFLDADDIWFDNKIEKQLNFMLENSVAFSFTDIIIVNDNGKRKKKHFDKIIDYKKLLKSNQISCLTVMIKSSLIRRLRMKDIGHEDYIFWLEILKKNDVLAYNANEILAFYRKSNNSLSGDKLKAAKWQWDIYRNELGLSTFSSTINFIHYAIKGFLKHL